MATKRLDTNKICLAYLDVDGGANAIAVEAVAKEVGRQIADALDATADGYDGMAERSLMIAGLINAAMLVRDWTGNDG